MAMNRRQFFGRVLGPIAAAVAVPELARTIFLPPRGGWPSALGDFDTANMRYIARERFSNACATPADLSEDSLEQLLISIREAVYRKGNRISFRPTRLIVHPSWTPEQVEERLARML